MDKNKKELIVLILLIFFGLNYGIYQFYMKPGIQKIEDKKQEFTLKSQQLNTILGQENNLKQMKTDVAKMEVEARQLDKMVIRDVDTLQLIYDFYAACKTYEIKGEDISFQLEDSGDRKDNNDDEEAVKLLKLSINLKASGNKHYMENFLRSLDKITDKKLNVAKISLQTEEAGQDAQEVIQQSEASGTTNQVQEAQDNNEIKADILFYQYLLVDGENYNKVKEYNFYDSKIGFDKIADMFR